MSKPLRDEAMVDGAPSRSVSINPDDFLETAQGRVWTPERGEAAWDQSYRALEQAIMQHAGPVRVVLVCGVQGAGKTSWIAAQPPCPGIIYYDAALPGVRHRAKIIAIARRFGAAIAAVFIDTPLAVAIERNACRSPDRIVPVSAIRSVAGQFELPSTDEGFGSVRICKGV